MLSLERHVRATIAGAANRNRNPFSEIPAGAPRSKTMDVAYIVAQWERVRAGLLETIDKFRDDELDFKPFATAWSLRQLMLHIAQEERGEFQYGIVQTLDAFPSRLVRRQGPADRGACTARLCPAFAGAFPRQPPSQDRDPPQGLALSRSPRPCRTGSVDRLPCHPRRSLSAHWLGSSEGERSLPADDRDRTARPAISPSMRRIKHAATLSDA